jgi:hypothetical protein
VDTERGPHKGSTGDRSDEREQEQPNVPENRLPGHVSNVEQLCIDQRDTVHAKGMDTWFRSG